MDPWVITPQERARFEGQFNTLKPVNGIVTGVQAKDFFLQSQLPPQVLGIIWGLADTDADGKMNINEFSIACKLINLKLRGFDIPKTLPANMFSLVQSAASSPGGNLLAGVAPARPPVPPAPSPLPMATAPLVPGIPLATSVQSQPIAPTKIISPPSGVGTPNLISPPGSAIPPTSVPSVPLVAGIQPVPTVPPTVPQSSVIGMSQTLMNIAPAVPMGIIPPTQVAPLASVGTPPSSTVSLTGVTQTIPPAATIPPSVPQPPVSVAPAAQPSLERVGSIESPLASASPLVEWAVPHSSKLKYTQLFNTTDRTRSGYLTGVQARNILMASQLPQPVLAQIWGLSDMDADGKLSCEEFVLAMHLCDLARIGEKIPVPLPPDLIPPTLRRQRQNSINSEQGDPLAGISTVTFEDKRKENFEKGQAELERRRKALLEIQRKEQEERERKEREEQEKKEKLRLEQERRRQQEFEKQLQKQRELEQQREEERRRAQEQREAARREMERQRQLEMEKQRSLELQAQRQREQETVLKLKAHNQNLSIELSQLNEKIKELSQKIGETRTGVTSVKATIDGMRSTRDAQLSEMSNLKARLKDHNARLLAISQEKARLEAKNKMNLANDPAGQEQAKIAFNNKQITLKQMRDKIQDMEKQIEVKLEDIENNNTQLGDLKKQLGTLISECEEIYVVYDQKRSKIIEMKGGRVNNISGWGDSAWDAAPTAWPEDNTVAEPGYKKYRALYEFVARNGDELSFQPGDIIMVPLNQNAEPGWLAGELRAATGWFPESYVEPVDSPTPGTISDMEAMQKRQLEGIVEVPENISDNGSAVVDVVSEVGPAVGEMPDLMLGLGTAVDYTVVALFNFQSSLPQQLTFNKGDYIQVSENQDSWWYGTLNDVEGWFPKSYVKLSTEPVTTIQPVTQPVSTGDIPPKEQEYYVALYPYQSEEAGDLCFNQGEVMLVIKKEGDWWTGLIGDRTGIFPSNYVQKADSQVTEGAPPVEEPVVEQTEVPQITAQPEEQPPALKTVIPDFTSLTSTQFDATSSGGEDSDSKSSKSGKKPEIATVIAPYQATSGEQLSLQRGQLIMIRKKTSTGWWEGELQAKGKKRQIGWFPASYVKTLGGGGAPSSGRGSTSQTPSKTPEPTPPPVAAAAAAAADGSSGEQVVALYPYEALNEDELSFEKDDIITVIGRDEPAWWRGELKDATGLFPSNYVSPLSESPVSNISLSREEKKRQQAIKELISTEQAYIDDMSVVHDVFEKPLIDSKIISPEQVTKIFVNWREIIVCNFMFLRSLRVRRDMSESGVIRMIGDILCENLPRMTVYVRFCSCQLSAAALLQKLTEDSFDFRQLTKKCQADPRTKGLPLSSFLVKPMQRITKYPLLIKKILEHTPPGHPDRQNLEEALSKAEEFLVQVNEGIAEKENSERLEWLQTHIQCDGLDEPLIFNSLTNAVVPRKFIHYGVLTKTKSGKQLVGFLLNDFLLLAQPHRPLVDNQFSFERNSNAVFKMYKQPLLLSDTIIINTPDSPDSTELKLEHAKVVHSLTVSSHNERNLWIKKINDAKKELLHNEKCHLQRQQSKQAQFGAVGRVLVAVLEGSHLKASPAAGKRGVFCEVSMGSQEHRTPLATANPSEPKWNASMQFLVKDLGEDVLCINVLDKGHYSPDEFLGRTEVRVADILEATQLTPGPITKWLRLHEVDSGEIALKFDLVLFGK
ncbi:dynamin associated protein 160 isoform X2 [Lycorma delicatula]|uniref:dynamin associated protein 160 isoform X2 n=1 Tax=Lycorma delicatula TaxID=130591 RepID=UPI003F5177F8